jgi:colanic acid biosynthesis glycosyl transferase WcaI
VSTGAGPLRRILITSSYYWPEGAGTAPYVTGLAEHLSERGYDVAVSTTFPHYPSWTRRPLIPLGTSEEHAGVHIRRRWLHVPARQSALQRAAYEGSMFALGATALPLRRPDIVLGFIPSVAAASLGALAARLYRRPYGLIVHDLVGPGAQQSGLAGHRVSRAVSRVELAAARGATGLGIIAEGFRHYFEEVGHIPAERIHRVRTWTRRVEPTQDRESARREMGWRDGEFICLHAGNMGRKQGLDNVLDAAALLAGTNVRVVLLGDGNDRERLQQRAAALGLDQVTFADFAGPGRYESLLAAADVLIVNQAPSVADMSLPSKLTSYFASGQPVVAAIAPDSETAREIGQAQAGIVVPPANARALADALLAVRDDPARGAALGERGLRFAREELASAKILETYERFALRVHADG